MKVIQVILILAVVWLAHCGNPTMRPSGRPTARPSSRKPTVLPSGRKPTSKPTVSSPSTIKLCPFHVDIDATLAHNAAPYTIPSTHPSVQPLLSPHMPRDHPNVDTLLKKRKKYPTDDHPYRAVNPFTSPVPPTQQCMEYTGYVPASEAGCSIQVYPWHPSADASINSGTNLPADHPLIDGLLRPYLPASHPNLDSLIAAKTPLPMGHPSVNPYLCVVPYVAQTVCAANVSTSHPSVNGSIANSSPLPSNHPLTDPFLRAYLPPGHPNTDALFAAKTSLPIGHPSIDPYLCKISYTAPKNCSVSILQGHPNVDGSINSGAALPVGHPLTDSLLRSYMPAGHKNIDVYLAARTPLPFGHPSIEPYLCRVPFAAPANCSVNVTEGHPNVDGSIKNGTSLPVGHPLTDPLLRSYMPLGHGNIDKYLAAKTPLPTGHPSIESFLCKIPFVGPAGCYAAVYEGHPNVDGSIKNGTSLPEGHPLAHPLLRSYMPLGHGNIDKYLAAKTPLPKGHPSIEPFLCKISFPDPPACVVNVHIEHPTVNEAINKGTALPTGHPLTDSLLRSYMPLGHGNIDKYLAAKTSLPKGHPSIDSYLCTISYASAAEVNKNKKPFIPHGHPNVDRAIADGSQCPVAHPKIDRLMRPMLPKNHGNCDKYVSSNTPLPFGHPEIHPYLIEGGRYTAGFLMSCLVMSCFLVGVIIRCAKLFSVGSYDFTKAHLSFRMKSEDMIKMQVDTPSKMLPSPRTISTRTGVKGLNSLVPTDERLSIVASTGGNASKKIPISPTTSARSTQLDDAPPKKQGDLHPIQQWKDEPLSPDVPYLSAYSSRSSSISMKNKVSDIEFGLDFVANDKSSDNKINSWEDNNMDSEEPSIIWRTINDNDDDSLDSPTTLPRRNLTLKEMKRLNSSHRIQMYDYGAYDAIPVPKGSGRLDIGPDVLSKLSADKKKRASKQLGVSEEGLSTAIKLAGKTNTAWGRIHAIMTTTRLPFFEWSLENMLVFLVYFTMNIVCVLIAPRQQYGRSLGSLAAFNTALLIVPATRNSILTLGLALPFDHVILYHRFFGRFTILCVVSHFWFFAFSYNTEPFIYLTGLGAMLFSFVILLSSLDFVRRKYFNVFYYSHYAFVGYIVLAYLHVSGTRPYILFGSSLYLADKLLRLLWMSWPRTMTVFVNKGDSIAHVRFYKNPLTKWLDMHRVGQYYFVNFPAVSMHEWHPFSVSSGPREDEVELHIRALGDHTTEIVKLAKERAGRTPTCICIDGPYGIQTFDYRRYPMLLLAGGGIGITPIMCMVKDIYDVGLPPSQHFRVAHAIETVYLMWVMPNSVDYESFRDDLQTCVMRSQAPGRPKLVLSVYITRSKEVLEPPLISGRPKIGEVFANMMNSHPDKPGLVFACGPAPMVNELWDQSIQSTIKGRLIDFHHEVFEF